jgi:DNA-binding Lrp family transcriptional regulator
MLIDKTDLVILRHLERAGRWLTPLSTQLKIPEEEISSRIKKLEIEGVIAGYKATIFVPPFLGGDWVWGCVLATASEREKTIERILQKIPFITEIWLNSNLPPHLGHNFSLVFYSKDFDTEVKFLKEIPEISYLEAYRISNYTFPMARIFSSEEKILIRNIFTHPTADAANLAEMCLKNLPWIQTKLEKLIWTPQNTDGVVIVLPEIHFKRIQNFCHCHFVLEISGNRDLLFDEFRTLGFDIVLDGRPFQGRYIQLEADIWGFNDLIAKKMFLETYKEVKIQGIIFAEEMRVVSDWGAKLISS